MLLSFWYSDHAERFFLRWKKVSKREKTSDTARLGIEEHENENYYFLWWWDKWHFPYNCLGLTDEDNSVSRTDNFVNVNVFNTVTSARELSYRWVLHYFSTITVGRIKIVTIYKRSICQVEWVIATLILCVSHCSESDSVSSRVFYSAVSTAPRFLFVLVVWVTWPRSPLGQMLVRIINHETCDV